MCGIVGIWRQDGPNASDPHRLQAMAELLVHRGPDDSGYLRLDTHTGSHEISQSADGVGPGDLLLGSRRLSIIDVSPAGRQPMTNETEDVFIVFNGEIYNYVELRRDLEARGHTFRSQTDTEVIVHAYEEWGEDCARKFNGMWAYALWDQRRRRLVCSRDRFGIKPFYYAQRDGAFIFASEAKAILAAVDEPILPDRATIATYLARDSYYSDDRTFFEGVTALTPAHNLVVSDGRVVRTRYWAYTDQSEQYDYAATEETFRSLFSDAVRLRLRADVPVGVLLSGGLDSTSVTAFASEHATRSPGCADVFTAVFPGLHMDEYHHARLVAERLGMKQHTVAYDAANFMTDLANVTWHMDAPPASGQVLVRWWLLELASRHVKVVLEGQGADEMLAGYVRSHFRPYARDELCRLRPGSIRTTGRRLAEAWLISRGEPVSVQGVLQELRRLRGRQHRDAAGREVLSPEMLTVADAAESAPSDTPFPDHLTNHLYHDHARWVLPHLLKFGDAMSMAHSVEARVPFLDHRVVEFLFGLPYDAKFRGGQTKYILRRAFSEKIPSEVLGRTDKIGFDTPVWRWLQPHMRSVVYPLLLSARSRDRGIYDMAHLEACLDRCVAGERLLGRAVFHWVALELWFQTYIDNRPLRAGG